ncbi:MAG: SRPBCC family protein [Candidatus Omnitrophota bacterium]
MEKHDGIYTVSASRVLPAKRWQVLRLLTRVQEFPKFMPNVKECHVLSHTRVKVVTAWKVEMGHIPISWKEEEIFDFHHFIIHFKAVEGDLEVFEGEWHLTEHPSGGTEVRIDARVCLGIPLLETIIGGVLADRVKKNFEAMLLAFDGLLTERRYQKIGDRRVSDVRGFGVIGHPYNMNHLIKYFQSFKPDMKVPSEEFLAKVFDLVPSYVSYDVKEFRGSSGKTTRGAFIACNIIPDLLAKDMQKGVMKVVESCKVAEKLGLGIVALGGFTSIAGETYGEEFRKLIHVPVTTGNTLTAALAIEGVLKAARLRELDLSRSKVTVIGGAGDIGSACARALVDKVSDIVITSRSVENLEHMRKSLAMFGKAKFHGIHDNNEAVRDADIVIAAASVSRSILDIASFKPGAIICDIGYPKNISYRECDRQDILIFSGGICSLPQEFNAGFDIGLPSSKVLYGCFSEAIVLALEERYVNYSWGKGNITQEKMAEILDLARKNGFELAPFFWGRRLVTDEEVKAIKIKT